MIDQLAVEQATLAWLCYDKTEDLSDQLADVCEDAAEWGHKCVGYFQRELVPDVDEYNEDIHFPRANLVGIHIDRGLGRVTFYGLADATKILTVDAVDKIENSVSEWIGGDRW